jgi:hypothetical protein
MDARRSIDRFDEYYLATESELKIIATEVMLCAGADGDSPEWNEAVATALMAQARLAEAGVQYMRLI